jgi:signal transduction histidine kinase
LGFGAAANRKGNRPSAIWLRQRTCTASPRKRLNNAAKHSGAQQISIHLGRSGEKILLEIRDDGKGLQQSSSTVASNRSGGMGLNIMKYRASVIGGDLSTESPLPPATPETLTLTRVVIALVRSRRNTFSTAGTVNGIGLLFVATIRLLAVLEKST